MSPLHSVTRAKDPEGQSECCIEFLTMWWEHQWNDLQLKFLAHCQTLHARTSSYWWSAIILLNGLKATQDQEAITVAEKLLHQFICGFCVPCQLQSNQGTNFEWKVFAEICKLLDIRSLALLHCIPNLMDRWNVSIIFSLKCCVERLRKTKRTAIFSFQLA